MQSGSLLVLVRFAPDQQHLHTRDPWSTRVKRIQEGSVWTIFNSSGQHVHHAPRTSLKLYLKPGLPFFFTG